MLYFSVKNVAKHLRLKSELYYYTANCSDPNLLEEIKGKFETILTGSGLWTDGCPCSVENVQVTCGDVRSRKKKAVNRHEHVINIYIYIYIYIYVFIYNETYYLSITYLVLYFIMCWFYSFHYLLS